MIKIIEETQKLISYLNGKSSVGFVPTMGNLHQGHISLLTRSIRENQTSVISIFVNPTQFGKGEDFSNYPRTLKEDVKKITDIQHDNSEIVIFSPKSEFEIYPNNKKETIPAIGPCNILEGAIRPGHFDGVVTVVKRLFEIISPAKAYFGKKDYQQLAIIKLLVEKFQFNIQIIAMPIIREDSGLAMSSRNSYLSKHQIDEALLLRNSLLRIHSLIKKNTSLSDIQKEISNILKDQRFNYISLRHRHGLKPLNNLAENKMVLLGNFQLGNIKLIDNIEI